MKAKAFQFAGPCGCGKYSEKPRAAIALYPDDEDEWDGEWLCMPCARFLFVRLERAIAAAKHHQRQGHIYRHDKWQKDARK